MSVFRKITLNTLIASGAKIVDTVFALFLIALLTRYLGTEGYGEYTTIIAYVNIFITFANLGLYNILLRDIGKPGANESELSSIAFTLRFFASLVIIPISILIALLLPYTPIIKIGIAIAGLSTLFLSLYQVLVPIFQKHFKIIYVSIAELTNRIIYLGFAFILFTKFNSGLIPVVWAMVIASLVNFVLVFCFAQRFTRIRINFNWKKWKLLLKEALPIGASIIFTLIYFRIDTVMLSIMKPAEDVGIYGLAYKILENLIFFPAMFVGFVVPVLSRYYIEDLSKFKETFQKVFNIFILGIVPLVVGLIFTASPIVRLLGGEPFMAASPVLQILSVAVGLIFLGSLYGQAIIIVKKQFVGMWIYMAGAIFNILINLYFIPRFSYTGAAITTTLTELFITISLIWIVSRKILFFPSLKIFLKAFLAILPVIAFLYLFGNLHVILLVVISAIIYSVVVLLLGGISKTDIKLFLRRT
jgi:O-antigen/teichoic acid export membrane protein